VIFIDYIFVLIFKENILNEIFQLPDDFIEKEQYAKDEIVLRNYFSNEAHINNKIALNQNMVQLILSGSKSVKNSVSEIIVRADQLIILPIGHLLTSDILIGKENFESIIIYFSDEAYYDFCLKYAIERKKKTADNLVFEQDSYLKNFVQSCQILCNLSSIDRYIKQAKFEELLTYLYAKFPQKMHSFQLNNDTISTSQFEIKKVVESYAFSKITLDELAFLCHMSLSTFKRLFTKIYKISPQKWMLQSRMEKAAQLLKANIETPSTVFEKVGYESLSSFSVAFKKVFGIAPSKFQEQNKN
jgi:AraC family transcriptional regulator, exoenzyme S synthesis regulatory protein ExsA